MNQVQITIRGQPQAKKRHRMTKTGHTYNPQSEVEAAIRWEMRQQLDGHEAFPGPCSLSIEAIFPRPKSHFGTGRNAGTLKASAPHYHTVKPDCDNITKIYADCMNGLVFRDDRQIVKAVCVKHYGDSPRVTITATQYKGGNMQRSWDNDGAQDEGDYCI